MNSAKEYVHTWGKLFQETRLPLAFEFVSEYGREFSLSDSPVNGRKEQGMCYKNALYMALYSSAAPFLYCEGWAVSPDLGVPIEHAWVVSPNSNQVIDPTWKYKNTEFFGVLFQTEKVAEFVTEVGVHGVFNNLYRLRQPAEQTRNRLQSMLWRPA